MGDLDWLPEGGVQLTRQDLERVLPALKLALLNTDALDVVRLALVEVAEVLAGALERAAEEE